MSENNAPKFFDNVQNRVVDDLREKIASGSKINIAAASFSIYAFEALKKELEKIEELNFLFTGDIFTKEKSDREAREFYIPRLNAERSLYGTDFEVKLRNELNQQAIAKECADWIRRKVKFKSNISGENMNPFLTIETLGQDRLAYTPLNNFTTSDLGEDRGNNAYSTTTRLSSPMSSQFFDTFESVWSQKDKLADVTDAVLDNITAAYEENSPEIIYFTALFNIFNEFLDDLNADYLPNEAIGFKESMIWRKLYDFQRDAVVGCISKLERHNGCILADSVGLGKTFSALGVIKYYEARNKNVLVLCPKRLSDNWNTFKNNYKNNPIAEDRLRYDVLYHTDLSRNTGESNGIDLRNLNWASYDLIVIDESHNFRNGGEQSITDEGDIKENRYVQLLNKVIRNGVKTKVLMLSATPVNTRFSDLKNQLMLAAEGDSDNFGKSLKTETPVDKIFREADAAFKEWNSLELDQRTSENLLSLLNFDFFELLDSVTIARSRKHIEKYYSDSNIGEFPNRLKPISLRPELTDLEGITFNTLYDFINELNLQIYTPLRYVHPSKIDKYIDTTKSVNKGWENREIGRNQLMVINLLKRAESSIYSFRLTTERIYDLIDATIDNIDRFEQGRGENYAVEAIDQEELDSDDANTTLVGQKFKIALEDMDYMSWRNLLQADKDILDELLTKISPINPDHDLKLQSLISEISKKVTNPINNDNKKVLIFTAFADTADYLYGELSSLFKNKFNLNSAVVTGTKYPGTTLKGIKSEFNDILTCFSPLSKNRDALFEENPGDIDILIATDCISEGQNLQDCDYLINYDIHWNPVRIIQRFGRIDRIGSKNTQIQLTNFWPDISLDDYINLKARVEGRMKLVNLTATGSDNPIDQTDNAELEYRKIQLKSIQEEVVDIEDISGGISIMDLGLNEFHLDLQELLKKYGDASHMPYGIHATAKASADTPEGVIFVLKNINRGVNIDKQNRLHPFYLVYITIDGKLFINHLQPKELLDKLRLLCRGKSEPEAELVKLFNAETNDGKDMSNYTGLLTKAIHSMIETKNEADTDSLFSSGGTTALTGNVEGLDDFELINFLVVKR
jgi:SNF2 family DNA or RNA helicase